MSIFHVGSSAHPKIMKNHYISSKNHQISSKKHRKIINFDRKLRTPKCEIFMCIYRKSECESERQKFDPNGSKIIDFELLFGRTTTGVSIFSVSNFDSKNMKNHPKASKNHEISSKNRRKIIDFDRKFGTPKCEILIYIYRKSECESERQKFDPNGPKIIDFELLFGRTITGV